MSECACGHDREAHRSLRTGDVNCCKACNCSFFIPKPKPVLSCLFCPFQGTRAELVEHSAACEAHPLNAKFAEMLTNRDYWHGLYWKCRKDLQAAQEELERARKDGERLRGALDEMYMGAIARMGLDKARAKYSRQYAALAAQPPSAGEEGK